MYPSIFIKDTTITLTHHHHNFTSHFSLDTYLSRPPFQRSPALRLLKKKERKKRGVNKWFWVRWWAGQCPKIGLGSADL